MDTILINAMKIVTSLKQSGMRIRFAESCTGGMIAAAITDAAEITGSIKLIPFIHISI